MGDLQKRTVLCFLNQANEVVKEIEAATVATEEEKSEDSAIDDLLADVEAQDSITPLLEILF